MLVKLFGSTAESSTTSVVTASLKAGCKYTLVADAMVTKLVLFCRHASATAKAKAMIYADSGGLPGALLAVSEAVTGLPSTRAWVNFPLSPPESLVAGDYWIAAITDANSLAWSRVTGTTGQAGVNADAYATGPTDPFGDLVSSFAFEFCGYAAGPLAMVSLKSALQKTQDFLAASGLFPGGTQIGEPTSAPNDVAAAVFMGDGAVIDGRYGTTSIQRRDITVRAYVKAFGQPSGDIEFKLSAIQATLFEAIQEGLDLGVTGIYTVDPTNLAYRTGYQSIGPESGKTVYRILDITVPLMVDETATES